MSKVVKENNKFFEREWKNIENRVVLPLWHAGYKSMYESLKLDYDDFVSLAGYELTKAISSFDDSKSNLYTFAANVIKRKANTELRDYGSRDKRKTLSGARSLNVSTDDNDDEKIDDIPSKAEEPNNLLSEKRVGEYLKNLSNRQLRIVVLRLLDFDVSDVRSILGMTRKEVNDAFKGLKSNELVRILHRRKF